MIEFFQDFDPLRSGYISKTQFKRALATMGLSKLGSQDLTEAQYQMLAKYYESSSSPDKVCWKQFHDDIENGRLHKYWELVISWPQSSTLMKNQFLSDF